MSTREICGRVVYFLLRPFIHIFIRGTRRAYIVVRNGDEILVVKNILGSGKWHLPGGGCHNGERYEQGAIRELYEEVGLTVDESALLPLAAEPVRAKRNFKYQLFSYELHEVPALRLDNWEILEAAWVQPSALNDRNAGESTLQAVSLIG